MLSYRKVEPNGLTFFTLAGLSEPLSEGGEEVVLFSPALIPYRQHPERCLALWAFFLSFFNSVMKTRRLVGAVTQVAVCCRGQASWEGTG